MKDPSWAELEALATGDPAEALMYCDASLAESADAQRTVDLLRAKALAHRALGDNGASLAALREASDHVEALGNPTLLARVEMSLAAAMVLSGHAADGLALLDPARREVDEVTRSMIELQRAGLLARLGSYGESLAAFDSAFDAMPSGLPAIFEADGRSNRGIALALTGRLGQAEREFVRAKRLFEAERVSSGIADCLLNLGWIAGLTGNVPLAFRCFDEADTRHRELGIPTEVLAQNRCDTFLAAGLTGEARATAEHAIEHMADAPALDRAEAFLRLSRAALADGDATLASDAARNAAALANGVGGIAPRAQMLEIEARRRSGELTRSDLDALGERIDVLSRSKDMPSNTLLVSELRLDAALVADALGETAVARQLLGAISQRRLSLPQRIARTFLLARLHRRGGDRAAATRALTYGQTLLARHRASIGATELRVQVAVHATELASFGLDMAFEGGGPARVLEWAELSRSASIHAPRSGRVRDSVLERHLDDLRMVLDKLARAEREGLLPPALVRQRDDIQKRVQLRSRQEQGRDGPAADRFRTAVLRAALGPRLFVSLVDHGGDTFAVVVSQHRTRAVRIGSTAEIRLEAEQLRRACRRAFEASDAARRAAHTDIVHRSAERLDRMIFGNVRLDDRPLVLSPTSSLNATPWACLPSLTDRPFVVTPSAATWLSSGPRPGNGPATLVAGPYLQHAEAEIAQIAEVLTNCTPFVGSAAGCQDVLGHLDGSRLAHFACHGSFTADHPMLSGLELADGRLTAYDIERLDQPPAVFVISACHGGLSTSHPGDELMGFTSALIGLGVSTVVASCVPVPDDERTLAFVVELHRRLADGVAAPDALLAARQSGVERIVGGAFTCFGRRADDVTPDDPPVRRQERQRPAAGGSGRSLRRLVQG